MDVIRQLSVTFPDCSESSVLDAITVVTLLSYNFPTGEKQHGSLVRSFVEQYKKILFHEVYLVLQFLLADIYNLEFQKFTSCRTYVRRQNIFCFSCLAQHIFSGLLSFSFSLHQHQNFIKLFRTVLLVCGFASVVSALLLRTLSFPTNQSQDSRFMTCFMFLFFFFFSFPKKG